MTNSSENSPERLRMLLLLLASSNPACHLRNGDILHLSNEDAVITNIAKPSKRDVY